jgi:parallel beta-helix repeat protein
MRYSLNALLSLIFLGIQSTLASACVLNDPRYRLASDTVRWSLELSSGETCIRGVRFNNVVVDKLMIVSSPQIGHVTLQGTGFSYKAAKDFQGSDFFSLMVSGATSKVPGNSMIEVEVSVSHASELRSFSTTILPSRKTSAPSLANPGTSSPPPPPPIDDFCGSSNDVAARSVPTTNLCSIGTASVVSGNGPWRWSCIGRDGGKIAQCSASLKTASSVQKPGPSADLFANPYYTCVNNYYISTSGSDINNGSSGSPWRTLQRADSLPRTPGDCINVAPGAYDGVTLSKGGNAATSTGYVVYRCQTLDGCTIKGNAGPNRNAAFWFQISASMANYVIIDGFNMVGRGIAGGSYGIGLNVFNGDNGAKISSHHIWVLNSVVTNFSQGGIAFAAGEYFYALHNTSYRNAGSTCDAQGSGIGLNIPHSIPGYVPTVDDKTNPNPLIGSFITGSDFFHNVFEWNVVYNNALTRCGNADNPYDTDGNGIIMDTFGMRNGNSIEYVNPTLIAFNVTYNNGGGGIHIFASEWVTVANNSCFNNYLDPYNRGSGGCIDATNSYSNTFINNIAVAIPGAHTTCAYYTLPYSMWASAILGSLGNSYRNNITDLIGSGCYGEVPMFNGDKYSATANKESSAPLWVDVGTTTPGTESTPPVGANFALRPGSPAINYGLTEPYLPPQSVDAGACSSTLSVCP